ncbi:MFS transporter [Actinomadura rubrisoli]|uniref:MFS transporter n=1 Tax=Actinomadura rubrisoli TaxID=2530368 RepID=A0A4R5C5D2_9ACTN|nr:MFS transporter [Actinomadura rubrisoli]TDD93849.1 MFS transporter [Actinomadura rubrisoli]
MSNAFSPLRHAPFRNLFFSGLISMIGDGVWLVAIPWIIIDIGGGPDELAAAVGAESVGLVLFVLAGGALADRYPRTRVVVFAHLAAFVTLALLVVAHLASQLQVWQLTAAAFVLGASAAVSGPALDAMTPDLVPEKDLHAANALDTVLRNVVLRLGGPALGGTLVAVFGSLTVIALNAASFALAAVFAGRVVPLHSRGADDDNAEKVSYAKALSYLASQRWLWILIAWAGLLLLLQTGPRSVLLPFLIHDDLHGGPRSYGLVLISFGVAATMSSLWVASRPLPRRYPLLMLLAWTISALPLAGMAFAPSILVLLLLGIVFGFFSAAGNVYWSTLVQTRVPDNVRGRIISIDWLGSLVLVPISMTLAGIGGARHFGTWLFVIGGLGPVLLTLIVLRYVDFRAIEREDSDGGGRSPESAEFDPSADLLEAPGVKD